MNSEGDMDTMFDEKEAPDHSGDEGPKEEGISSAPAGTRAM